MKKLILALGVILGINGLCAAQNSVSLQVDDKLCIESFEVLFRDNSTEKFALGCTGEYRFDVGAKEPEALIINGVTCYEGKTKLVVNGQKIYTALTKVIQVDQQKLDGILNLIR